MYCIPAHMHTEPGAATIADRRKNQMNGFCVEIW